MLPELNGHSVHPAVALSYPLCLQQYQNGESEESHEQFLKALQNAVSTFVNRMKSNHMRGRSITNDSAVLSLFQSINTMHPQLLELLNQLDERRRRCPPSGVPLMIPGALGHPRLFAYTPLSLSIPPQHAHVRWSHWWGLLCSFLSPALGPTALLKENRGPHHLGSQPMKGLSYPLPYTVYYEGLQDKLAQIRDARGALSALREEHREKLRRAVEEAERQRQIQLAQKLEIMRQKKQVWQLTQHVGRGGPG